MASTTENEIWISPSTSRKKRKGRQQPQSELSLLLRLQSVQDNLNTSWLDSCIKILEPLIERPTGKGKGRYSVTCLGLGSPESSDNARAQMAFLLKVCDNFGIEHSSISVFDPVFTDEDKSLFRELGICVLDSNGSATRRPDAVDGPTLLFMPHCDLTLYEDVLSANWSLDHLGNILFACNTFADYLQNNSARSLEDKAPHLLKITPRMTTFPLPSSPDWPGAFNNTSVQHLSRQDAGLIPESWFAEGA